MALMAPTVSPTVRHVGGATPPDTIPMPPSPMVDSVRSWRNSTGLRPLSCKPATSPRCRRLCKRSEYIMRELPWTGEHTYRHRRRPQADLEELHFECLQPMPRRG